MNLKKLLELGYFPKELPPPFSTKIFAEKSRWIKAKWENHLDEEQQIKPSDGGSNAAKRRFKEYHEKYESSQLTQFSLAKGPYMRRKLAFPNPKQMMDLSVAICENWEYMRDASQNSAYSQSYPVEFEAKRTLRTKSKTWNEFKFDIIEKSFDKKIEVRLDISKYYPSVYTHSIPWALLGREKAKRLFKISNTQKNNWNTLISTGDVDANNYRKLNHIDTLVRNCNERQSVGLPIGPDTSFLLAECVASRIDQNIAKRLTDIDHEGVRYFDDYYFYVNSVDDAEKVLKTVLQTINDFQLEVNESKTSISELPFKYNDEWAAIISMFKFKNIDKFELRDFFSILFDVVTNNRSNTSWILNYALGRFEYGRVRIARKDWDLFLSFLLKSVLVDPSNIDQVFKIVLSYKDWVNEKSKTRLRNVLHTVLEDHIDLNHSFEVSWALWFCRSFKIKIDAGLLRKVLASEDSLSILIVLDIIELGLYQGGKPGVSNLSRSLSGANLFDSKWLIVYESYVKGWLSFEGRQVLDSNVYMKFMNDYGVEFYNPNNQVRIEFNIGESGAADGGSDINKGPYGYLENNDNDLNLFDDLDLDFDLDEETEAYLQSKLEDDDI